VNPPTLQNQPGPDQLLERLADAFNLYDVDKNGTLHIGELYGVLVFELGQKQFEGNFPAVVEVMNYFDQSRDGELSIDEFMAIFFFHSRHTCT